MPIYDTKNGRTLFMCDDCGQFVSHADLVEGRATVKSNPDVPPWDEDFFVSCPKHTAPKIGDDDG